MESGLIISELSGEQNLTDDTACQDTYIIVGAIPYTGFCTENTRTDARSDRMESSTVMVSASLCIFCCHKY